MPLAGPLVVVAVALFAPTNLAAAGENDFSFVVLGDTAYNGERDYPVYEALIDRINAAGPAFTIHVGDIWGAGNCDDDHYELIQSFFGKYTHPVVYTPGDNEWTDCWHPVMGGYDTSERLAHIRKTFFSDDQSLGGRRMSVVRQADISPYKNYVENARWERGGVLFATAHVVGSQNNQLAESAEAMVEFHARNLANVAWINDAFRLARQQDYRALVLAVHAEMLGSGPAPDPSTSFGATLEALRLGAERFARPVLLIHGDAHRFIIDRPLLEYRGEEEPPRLANLTRLQVYGAPEIRAVRVRVEPDTPWVFSFSPLYGE